MPFAEASIVRRSIRESLSDERLSEADAEIIANSCSDNALRGKAVGFGEKCRKFSIGSPAPRRTTGSKSRNTILRSSTCFRCSQAPSTGLRSGAYGGSRSTCTARPSALARKSLTLGTAVDGRPILDHQKAAPDVVDQVPEELDRVKSLERYRAHQDVNPTRRSDTAHDREVIAGLPLVEDGCVPLGGVGLDPAWQQVETRFVHKNQGPTFATRLRFQTWPGLGAQRSISCSSHWMARASGIWGVHPDSFRSRETWLL